MKSNDDKKGKRLPFAYKIHQEEFIRWLKFRIDEIKRNEKKEAKKMICDHTYKKASVTISCTKCGEEKNVNADGEPC